MRSSRIGLAAACVALVTLVPGLSSCTRPGSPYGDDLYFMDVDKPEFTSLAVDGATVWGVGISPGETLLAAGLTDGRVVEWGLPEGGEPENRGTTPVRGGTVAYVGPKSSLLSGGPRGGRLHDAAQSPMWEGMLVSAAQGGSVIAMTEASPATWNSAIAPRAVRLLDAGSGRTIDTVTLETGPARALAVNTEGTRVALLGGKEVAMWSAETMSTVTWPIPSVTQAGVLAMSESGRVAVAALDRVYVIEADGASGREFIAAPGKIATALCWLPNDEELLVAWKTVVASATPQRRDPEMQLRDRLGTVDVIRYSLKGKERQRWTVSAGAVSDLVSAPSGTWVAAAAGTTVRILPVEPE